MRRKTITPGRQAAGKPAAAFSDSCCAAGWAPAGGLEGHRLLHVRPAQLSHAHVDRHLTAFEGRSALGARAGARALLPTAGGLAGARAFAAPDALAGTTAAGRGRQVVQADALLLVFGGGAHLPSLTSTRRSEERRVGKKGR